MAGVVHISEEEAARDVKGLFERVRSGERLVIEAADRPDVMMTLSKEPVKARSIAEVIKALETPKGTHGLALLDANFAADVAEVRERYNSSEDHPAWERRTIAEARQILRLRREAQGLAVPDPGFASDMDAVRAITNAPADYSRWD